MRSNDGEGLCYFEVLYLLGLLADVSQDAAISVKDLAVDQGNLALQIKCSKIHKENSFTERPRTGEPVRGLVCA